MSDIDTDKHSRVVMLTFGQMDHGGPYWCYVAVKPSRYDEFQKLMASKKYNMQNFAEDGFGEVIVSGEGSTPPTDVTKTVAFMFNVPLSDMFKIADVKQEVKDKVREATGN